LPTAQDSAGELGLDIGHTITLVVFCLIQPIVSSVEKFEIWPYQEDNICKKRMS
jgi:hypothetical protein